MPALRRYPAALVHQYVANIRQGGAINPQTGAVPVSLRRAQGPDIQGLLHTQNEPGKTTQPGAYRPGKETLLHPVCHA